MHGTEFLLRWLVVIATVVMAFIGCTGTGIFQWIALVTLNNPAKTNVGTTFTLSYFASAIMNGQKGGAEGGGDARACSDVLGMVKKMW